MSRNVWAGSFLSIVGLVCLEALQRVYTWNRHTSPVAYLGNFSASKSTVSMPSRASTAAVYEPPGPPPTTNTVHFSGIDILKDKSFEIALVKE